MCIRNSWQRYIQPRWCASTVNYTPPFLIDYKFFVYVIDCQFVSLYLLVWQRNSHARQHMIFPTSRSYQPNFSSFHLHSACLFFISSTNCLCFHWFDQLLMFLIDPTYCLCFIGSTYHLRFSLVCQITHETCVCLCCCWFVQLLTRLVGWSSSNIFLKNTSCGQEHFSPNLVGHWIIKTTALIKHYVKSVCWYSIQRWHLRGHYRNRLFWYSMWQCIAAHNTAWHSYHWSGLVSEDRNYNGLSSLHICEPLGRQQLWW